MKHLLLISISLFFITACENKDQFASILDNQPVPQASRDEPSEQIKKLVSKAPVKISGKKRQQIKIGDTVGANNLKGAKRTVTRIDVTSNIVVTEERGKTSPGLKNEEAKSKKTSTTSAVTVTNEQKTVMETAKTVNKEASLGPKLNILFYMNQRSYGSCVDNLRVNHQSFLAGISKYNWNVSFAYYTITDELMPLEYSNGTAYNSAGFFKTPVYDYTLSKGEYNDKETARYFQTTLQEAVSDHHEHSMGTEGLTSNYSMNIIDPLAGLDQILNKKIRKEGKTVVLFFGDEFPYYSTAEWNKFYSWNPNVSIVVLSYRHANVSNFMNVLEKKHDFSFIPDCDVKEVLKKF